MGSTRCQPKGTHPPGQSWATGSCSAPAARPVPGRSPGPPLSPGPPRAGRTAAGTPPRLHFANSAVQGVHLKLGENRTRSAGQNGMAHAGRPVTDRTGPALGAGPRPDPAPPPSGASHLAQTMHPSCNEKFGNISAACVDVQAPVRALDREPGRRQQGSLRCILQLKVDIHSSESRAHDTAGNKIQCITFCQLHSRTQLLTPWACRTVPRPASPTKPFARARHVPRLAGRTRLHFPSEPSIREFHARSQPAQTLRACWIGKLPMRGRPGARNGSMPTC